MDFKKKNMKIIIFGAAGSIGYYLAKKYLKEDHEILLFVKNKKSKEKLSKLLNLKMLENVIIDHLDIKKKNLLPKKLTNMHFFLKKLI